MILKLLFNPFEKIAGYSALLTGVSLIMLTSFFAALNGIHFSGVLNVQMGAFIGFSVPFLENLINWAYLCLIGYLLCKGFSKSKFRLVDLVGTVALSRYPLVFAALMGFMPGVDRQNPYDIVNFLVGFTILFFVIWSQILLFNALKVSANLKDNKKWLVYFILITFTAITSGYFFNKIYLLIL